MSEDLLPIHTRAYDVQAFRRSATEIVLRGSVRDTKPANFYIPDDPEPLAIHTMVVELSVAYPSLEILAAEVVFEAFPNATCPSIIDAYQGLIGLSIARGFTHKVRELFGGPRGCTHTTALLQAMAPVAVQCGWSMEIAAANEGTGTNQGLRARSPEGRAHFAERNVNTCHVWDEDGEHLARIRSGQGQRVMLTLSSRLTELGHDPDEWLAAR